MKPTTKTLLLLAVLLAVFASAQANNISQVQHVVIVVQENRTPTNLFLQDQTLINHGAHIVSTLQVSDKCGNSKGFALQSTGLFTCWDTGHNYDLPKAPDWMNMWDKGGMDGACQISVSWIHNGHNNCGGTPSCVKQSGPPWKQTCSYTYVCNTGSGCNSPGILNPYFQIASQFGYANYMFQTNQGPSFPAHLFLLSGTSAPDQINDSQDNTCGSNYLCHQWFATENATAMDWGCTSSGANIYEADPTGDNVQGIYNGGYPCYNHKTLVDLLDGAKITWKYYARNANGLWTAPTAISGICQPTPSTQPGDVCTGPDWINNVQAVFPNQGNYANDSAPILTDIGNCNLPQVSWVIPDGNWSDHAGGDPSQEAGDGGPSWVAAIVNAIGQNSCSDMVNGNPVPIWQDTVILITWDDWGGYYDDVVPPDCKTSPCTGYSNLTGAQYVYGFRVPLLVVGAYAKPGYISGANAFPPNCLPPNTYCHDFGSILNFVEYAFGTGGRPLGYPGGISPNYNYADALAMDYNPSQQGSYSLQDFFDFTAFHSFQTINGAKYPPDCFHHPHDSGCFTTYPLDPDNDAIEAN